MRIRTSFQGGSLSQELGKKLLSYRRQRGFDAAACSEAKIALINGYFKKNKLTAAVIAISGGVDSAVALGLLHRAAQAPKSPLKNILPITLPVFGTVGVTGQTEATNLAQKVGTAYGREVKVIDLSPSFVTLHQTIEATCNLSASAWARGQLVPYLRTPTLYYLTSLLTDSDTPAVVCGTTNRDEGAYLGFFGKASDGMVDLQLIADLHKSEVYALGEYLGIPTEVVKRPPTGDMFDAAPDEHVFGAPYDFVELYLHFLTLPENTQKEFLSTLSRDAQTEFSAYQCNLEKLHRYNAHKYKVGSPAVHLNAYRSGVPGGWAEPESASVGIHDATRFVNERTLPSEILQTFFATTPYQTEALPLAHPSGLAWKTSALCTTTERGALQKFFNETPWQPVSIHGTGQNFDPNTDKIGSYRLSWYNPELADLLWQRIQSAVPMVRTFTEKNHPEGGGTEVWRACGVSELFRAVKYETGGWLVPHYDAPFAYTPNRRTLLSLVMYMDDAAGDGGATRFLREPVPHITTYADWERAPLAHEIVFRVTPRAGEALVFDHRLLHDGERVASATPKIIIRTDIVYERIDTRYV